MCQYVVARGSLQTFVKGVTKDEEVALARSVQRLRRLEDVRSALAHGTGRTEEQVPDFEWAQTLGVDFEYLSAEKQRGAAARATLTQANLRLVVSIAKRYRFCGLDREDLLGVADVLEA